MPKKTKQAVLLIHGIGEQRPMDTLRGFVNAVWTTDDAIHHKHAIADIFSKPDLISGNFELRRLTTTKNRKDIRTDFYEFYWAHLMEGTSLEHVLAWVKTLLWRWPWTVPQRLISAWFLLVALILIIAFFGLQTILPEMYRVVLLPRWLTAVSGVVVTWIAIPIINTIIGDAARYLNPAPANIHTRQEIRSKGVDILRKLHESNEYNRIIVVGHSLGSIIGYDILSFAWSLFNQDVNKKNPHPVLDELENSVEQQTMTGALYQEKQRDLLEELNINSNPWLVTDFITLGSPLTHADILLSKNKKDLIVKQTQRELPTCPPILESGKFSFPPDEDRRTLHHGAVFGPTKWTNLYFPSRGLIYGDLIGGPLQDLFGCGIWDQEVKTKIRCGILSHSYYWKNGNSKETASHITALRDALNLLDN
jgi:hypothetical protein